MIPYQSESPGPIVVPIFGPSVGSKRPSLPPTPALLLRHRIRYPRVMRTELHTHRRRISIPTPTVVEFGLLTCDSCSSPSCFACGFCQQSPRGGHLAVRPVVPSTVDLKPKSARPTGAKKSGNAFRRTRGVTESCGQAAFWFQNSSPRWLARIARSWGISSTLSRRHQAPAILSRF